MTETKNLPADWKSHAANRVAEVREEEAPNLATVSLASGIMSIDDMAVPNNNLDVIIVAVGTERTFYNRPYDADDRSPPECYAQKVGNDDTFNPTMEPASNVPEPVSDSCATCPMAKLGSADTGRGPACKTRRKLICAPASVTQNPESLGKSLVMINVPPTSGKAFSQHLIKLAAAGVPPEFAVTNISYGPDKKTMFAMKFDAVENIEDDNVLGTIVGKLPEFEPMLTREYSYEEEEKAPAENKKRKH
jgi:hypothetical protein